MKLILTNFIIFFSIISFANESKDLAQLLSESKCVPTRSRSGKVSYKCDGTLGAELEEQSARAQQPQTKPLMQTKTTLQVYPKRQSSSIEHHTTSAQPTDAKIKSCLASIYQNQVQHHQSRGKYTTISEDMGIDRNETCNGLYIYTNVANEREFKITARFGKNIWTVDQSRNIMKMR